MMGDSGLVVADARGVCHLSAVQVHAVDTTAACDTFSGAMRLRRAGTRRDDPGGSDLRNADLRAGIDLPVRRDGDLASAAHARAVPRNAELRLPIHTSCVTAPFRCRPPGGLSSNVGLHISLHTRAARRTVGQAPRHTEPAAALPRRARKP